jgi:hypothetical protein
MNPASTDVLKRAGKTAVQAFLPSVVYATRNEHAIAYPVLLSGAIGAGAAAVSVLWNGSSALLGAHRAKQLATLAGAIDAAVARVPSGRRVSLPPATAFVCAPTRGRCRSPAPLPQPPILAATAAAAAARSATRAAACAAPRLPSSLRLPGCSSARLPVCPAAVPGCPRLVAADARCRRCCAGGAPKLPPHVFPSGKSFPFRSRTAASCLPAEHLWHTRSPVPSA